VLEAAGEGNDRVIASVSYALAAGSEVETLEAVAGSAAINLAGNEFANTIIGNAGDNVLQGGMGADILEGGDGNDVLYGEGGIDTARGGAGDDVYVVDASTDVVEEAYGGGNDTVLTQVSYLLTSGAEVELLSTTYHAGTANIELTGNYGDQTIIGNAGANVITGGVGADVLIGLAGDDTYIVHDARAVVLEDAGQGNDTVFTSVSYALAAGQSIEVLSTSFHGGTGAIDLTGNALAQTIYGNNGSNVIQGGGGADVLIGLGGDDIYRVDSSSAHVFEAIAGGNDQVYTSVSFALDADQEIEFFAATDFAGTDAINLTGNNLNNTIYGNAGNNVLDGKGGNDALVGLAGADTYAFTTALGAGNVDTIFGFEHGVDKIALDDAIFAAIGPLGTLNANAFVVGTAAADADDRIIYNSLTGQLFYDADGNGAGAAVQFATMSPGLPLTASDFTVI
jgi:Ca2+-binding RTX toxin-like protein